MMFGWRPNPRWNASLKGLAGLVLSVLLSAGAAHAEDPLPAPAFRVGMGWTYQQREDITGRDIGAVRLEVVAVVPGQVTVNLTGPGEEKAEERWDASGNWQQVGSRGWDWLGRLGGQSKRIEFLPALALYRFPLQAGASWVETARAADPDGTRKTEIRLFAKALKWEEVTVPAGKFRALKVRRTLTPEDSAESRARTIVTLLDWYSPQVAGSVKTICDWEFQDTRRPRGDQLVKGGRVRWELTGYTPGK